jgi:hypothetical protein
VTDVFQQSRVNQLDLLVVIDNSCSMGDEQTKLRENFPFFMDFFLGSGLDYQIGITSSDLVWPSEYNGSHGKTRPGRAPKKEAVPAPAPARAGRK